MPHYTSPDSLQFQPPQPGDFRLEVDADPFVPVDPTTVQSNRDMQEEFGDFRLEHDTNAFEVEMDQFSFDDIFIA